MTVRAKPFNYSRENAFKSNNNQFKVDLKKFKEFSGPTTPTIRRHISAEFERPASNVTWSNAKYTAK